MNINTFFNKQSAQLRTQYVDETASRLHDMWRAPRALPEGGFEPRVKPDGKGGEVDIANTDYKDLPEKWKAENHEAAVFIVGMITANPKADMEVLAAAVHEDWLSRNGQWAEPEQNLPYAQLSEIEKEKDRVVVSTAMSAINDVKKTQSRSWSH